MKIAGDRQARFLVLYSQPIPKKRSKKTLSFSMIVRFFFSLPPPNLDTDGMILSISVPVVLIPPSRKEFSMNLCVSSGCRFSSLMISQSCFSRSCATYSRHSPSTSDTSLMPSIKLSISAFLLRSSGLASIALWMVMRTSLSSPCES